jgi:sigma-B regulation protein RsbU (phosphoserine phosphatase)
MAKAALTSLIGTGRSPAKVLERLDQVLRAAGADRNFTTLALLRLWPESGEAVFANAGHPYPLLLQGGELSELELPSLPLGRGPARTYREIHLHLPPGAALVFCSDGLFEAVDRSGQLYGFDRLRARVRKQRDRSAERIVQGLFGDWEQHLRTVQPLDDTTVLVVRRLERGA